MNIEEIKQNPQKAAIKLEALEMAFNLLKDVEIAKTKAKVKERELFIAKRSFYAHKIVYDIDFYIIDFTENLLPEYGHRIKIRKSEVLRMLTKNIVVDGKLINAIEFATNDGLIEFWFTDDVIWNIAMMDFMA